MFSTDPDYVNSPQDTVSFGKRVSFLQGMETAYNASVYESANKSEEIQEMFALQNQRLRELGEQNIPDVSFFGATDQAHVNVRDLEAVYSGNEPFYQTQEDFDAGLKAVTAYDTHVAELRKKYPNEKIKTSYDMVEEFQQRARDAATLDANQRRTTLGSIGGFVGAVGAGVDPRYNLFNTLTLGVGGVGKQVVTRVGTEALGQAGIEAVNEVVLGGRTTREMRGLDSSWGGTWTRIATAGAGGALIRGVGEGVGAGYRAAGRRWFNDAPNDPAPAAPPIDVAEPTPASYSPEMRFASRQAALDAANPVLARTRVGASRVITDMDDVRTQLDAWDGASPAALRPRADTAALREVDGVRYSEDFVTQDALGRTSLDDRARRVDPDVFREYDRWTQKLEAARQDLAAMKSAQTEETMLATAKTLRDMDARIAQTEAKIADRKTSARTRRGLEEELDNLRNERDAAAVVATSRDTPREASTREWIQKIDTKMRDLAPVMARAYDRARGDFTPSPEIQEMVDKMVELRAPTLAEQDARAIVESARRRFSEEQYRPDTPVAASPVLSRIPEGVPPGTPLVEAAAKVVENDVKIADEGLTAFRGSLDSLLKEDNDVVTIGTTEMRLSDSVEVPNADGEGSRTVTVRQLLEEMSEDEQSLKAMKTCSI